jgi:hypothetical protein
MSGPAGEGRAVDILYEETGTGEDHRITVLRAMVDATQKTLKVRRRDVGAAVRAEHGVEARDEGVRIRIADLERLWPVLVRELAAHHGIQTIDRLVELCRLADIDSHHWSADDTDAS